ncbi:hypothetical protein Zmor_009941 [Zophobas morio]|uniref:Uncharacterized protein n=1 Tax=Zophobas morio TaxID=2755281 RepID=A0AA38IMZ8_9CUCU|nr:hypothetical protein Zmor_009941 [Zophobas morio]
MICDGDSATVKGIGVRSDEVLNGWTTREGPSRLIETAEGSIVENARNKVFIYVSCCSFGDQLKGASLERLISNDGGIWAIVGFSNGDFLWGFIRGI